MARKFMLLVVSILEHEESSVWLIDGSLLRRMMLRFRLSIMRECPEIMTEIRKDD